MRSTTPLEEKAILCIALGRFSDLVRRPPKSIIMLFVPLVCTARVRLVAYSWALLDRRTFLKVASLLVAICSYDRLAMATPILTGVPGASGAVDLLVATVGVGGLVVVAGTEPSGLKGGSRAALGVACPSRQDNLSMVVTTITKQVVQRRRGCNRVVGELP